MRLLAGGRFELGVFLFVVRVRPGHCIPAISECEDDCQHRPEIVLLTGMRLHNLPPAINEVDLNVPDEAQLAAISEEGEKPVVVWVPTVQEEISRVVNEVLALRDSGLQVGKLLVIHANSSLEKSLRIALEKRLGIGQVHDAKSGAFPAGAFPSERSNARASAGRGEFRGRFAR